MVEVNAKITGLDDLVFNMLSKDEQMREGMVRVVEQSSKRLRSGIRKGLARRTGKTRASVQITQSTSEITGFVFSDWFVARLLENGTGVRGARGAGEKNRAKRYRDTDRMINMRRRDTSLRYMKLAVSGLKGNPVFQREADKEEPRFMDEMIAAVSRAVEE